jgi:hypothetical protein
MTTATETKAPAAEKLSLDDLDAVAAGHGKFRYVEMNGHTYAVGHVNGQTVMVKVA